MEEKVEITPGATVPRSWFIWAKIFPKDERSRYDITDIEDLIALEESPIESMEGAMNFLKIVEDELGPEAVQTFINTHKPSELYNATVPEGSDSEVMPNPLAVVIYKEIEKSRRLEVVASRQGQPTEHRPRNHRPINTLNDDSSSRYDDLISDRQHWGVNRILEYIGFEREAEKTDYLRSFNRNPDGRTTDRGVDAVRTGWHIALLYGATGDKDFVKAAVQSVGTNGAILTDAAIQKFGSESLPDTVENYSSLRVNGLLSLVPTRDLGYIISAMRDPILGDIRGPAFMRELGFDVYRLGRTPILYSKPTQK